MGGPPGVGMFRMSVGLIDYYQEKLSRVRTCTKSPTYVRRFTQNSTFHDMHASATFARAINAGRVSYSIVELWRSAHTLFVQCLPLLVKFRFKLVPGSSIPGRREAAIAPAGLEIGHILLSCHANFEPRTVSLYKTISMYKKR
jgi:hypothetical protein